VRHDRRPTLAAEILLAEHLLELPTGRQIEWKLSAGEMRAVRTARRLVDRDEAGEPRDEMVIEGERQDAAVRILGRDFLHGARDLKIGDLAPRPQLGETLPFCRAAQRQRDDPRALADHAPDFEGSVELRKLGGDHERLAAIEIGEYRRSDVAG